VSNRHKIKFSITVNEQRANFWRAAHQAYTNCEFSSGLIRGIEPDTIYLRFDKDGQKSTTFMLRPDEALAVIHVLSGALWSDEIFTMTEKKKRTNIMENAE
jgi:hypothetical protein